MGGAGVGGKFLVYDTQSVLTVTTAPPSANVCHSVFFPFVQSHGLCESSLHRMANDKHFESDPQLE